MFKYTVTPAQRERLAPRLSNITYLTSFLSSGATQEDVYDMLLMELYGEKRRFIIDRLVGKLTTYFRKELKKNIDIFIN